MEWINGADVSRDLLTTVTQGTQANAIAYEDSQISRMAIKVNRPEGRSEVRGAIGWVQAGVWDSGTGQFVGELGAAQKIYPGIWYFAVAPGRLGGELVDLPSGLASRPILAMGVWLYEGVEGSLVNIRAWKD